jgi:hypothetical protein
MDEYERVLKRCKCNFKRKKSKCVRVRPDTTKPFKRVTKRCSCGFSFNKKTDNCEPSLPKPVRVLQPPIQTDRQGKKCPDTFKYNRTTKKCIKCPEGSVLVRGKCLMLPTDDSKKESKDIVHVVLPPPDIHNPNFNFKDFLTKFESAGKQQQDPMYKSGRYMNLIYVYLIRKYATNCAIFRDLFHSSQTMALNYFVDTNSLDYSKTILREMKDCVKRGSDLIFITIYIVSTAQSWAHVNILIYRPFKRVIERYEPHGSELFSEDYSDYKLNATLKDFFEGEDARDVLIGFTPVYRTPAEICPAIGFQGLENLLPRNAKESGYCQLWNMFMMETILLNPTLNTKDIIHACITEGKNDPTYFKNVIRGYTENMALEIKTFLKKNDLKLGSLESVDAFNNLDMSALITKTLQDVTKLVKPMAAVDKTPTNLSIADLKELNDRIDELTPQQVYIYCYYLNELSLPFSTTREETRDKLKNKMLSEKITWNELTRSIYEYVVKDKPKVVQYFLIFEEYPNPFIGAHIEIPINPNLADELISKYPLFHTFWGIYNSSRQLQYYKKELTESEKCKLLNEIEKLPKSKLLQYLSLVLYYTKTPPPNKQHEFDLIPDKHTKLFQYLGATNISLIEMEIWASF